ncbi:LacI family DNA-binding transcriptional regulator [Shigella flexneri]
MMTTMLEVAKRAGVSKATVSRCFPGTATSARRPKPRVSAIEECGYRPNLLARSLAAKTTADAGPGGNQYPLSRRLFSELLFHTARMAEIKDASVTG